MGSVWVGLDEITAIASAACLRNISSTFMSCASFICTYRLSTVYIEPNLLMIKSLYVLRNGFFFFFPMLYFALEQKKNWWASKIFWLKFRGKIWFCKTRKNSHNIYLLVWKCSFFFFFFLVYNYTCFLAFCTQEIINGNKNDPWMMNKTTNHTLLNYPKSFLY